MRGEIESEKSLDKIKLCIIDFPPLFSLILSHSLKSTTSHGQIVDLCDSDLALPAKQVGFLSLR